jgi:hypothetical protein
MGFLRVADFNTSIPSTEMNTKSVIFFMPFLQSMLSQASIIIYSMTKKSYMKLSV